MPQQQKISKKLPKRCTNERLKSRRAASWARTQARKKARRDLQEAAYKRNQKLRAAGLPTPHEAKKLAAKEKKRLAAIAATVQPGLRKKLTPVCMIPDCGCIGEAHP